MLYEVTSSFSTASMSYPDGIKSDKVNVVRFT